MPTRDSFQSSVSESEKSVLLPRPSFLSLDLEDFPLFSCSAAPKILRLRNHKSSNCTLARERRGSPSPFSSLLVRRETGGNENARSYLKGQFVQLLRDML